MNKSFDKGRLQVKFIDGTKSGKKISVGNMVENFEDSQIGVVAEALGDLVDYPMEVATVTQSYKYIPEMI